MEYKKMPDLPSYNIEPTSSIFHQYITTYRHHDRKFFRSFLKNLQQEIYCWKYTVNCKSTILGNFCYIVEVLQKNLE